MLARAGDRFVLQEASAGEGPQPHRGNSKP
jgi:hypothetical protein